jgi:Lrp/AsnC family leucine-responsive transcriptional regulator
MAATSLTNLDWEILALLQQNSRVSISQIASQLNRSRSNISEHMEKLQGLTVIDRFTSIINPEILGFGISAFIRLEASSKDHRSIISQLCELPEVAECHVLTGTELVVLRVVATNMTHLREFVDGLTQFGSTQTDIIFSTVKKQLAINSSLKKCVETHK